jgi:hypothetical protein
MLVLSSACLFLVFWQVYVAWSGTDKNGNYFTSSSFRFSQFRAMQAKGYADSLS